MDLKLSEAGLGAVEERFGAALKEVIENVMDPNRAISEKRKITIEFEFQPNKDSRGFCKLLTSVKTKLAPMVALDSAVSMGIDHKTGEMNAREHVQQPLFPDPPPQRPDGEEDPLAAADNAAQQGDSTHIVPFAQRG